MEVVNLKKEYKIKNGAPVYALNNVSFALPQSGMVFILGKSGSGKSTLLNMLAGLDKPTEGEIFFQGKALSALSAPEFDYYRNTYCGFVFQEYNVLPELTVGENISLAVEMQGEKDIQVYVKEVLEQVELSGYENRRVDELSGGQKQRVAIARALIKRPKIIFADEPTGALDSETGEIVLSFLKKISKEKLVLIVTHDRESAKRFGDRIIELADGEIIRDTSPLVHQEETKEVVKFIKPRMPIGAAVKLGFANFKMHPVRFAVTLLLSVIAFTLFCVPLDILFWDEKQAFVDAVYEENVEYSVIWKRRYIGKNDNGQDFSLDRFLGSAGNKEYENVPMTDEEIEVLSDTANVPTVKVSWAQVVFLQNQILNLKDKKLFSQFQSLKETASMHYGVSLEGFISMDETALEYFDYTLIGRLPQNENEVAIPLCLYNTFEFFGIIDSDGINYDISKPEDIIGKNLNIEAYTSKPYYAKIVGVVDTHCERGCFDTHWNNHYEFHEKAFVCDSFLPLSDAQTSLVYVTPTEKKDFQAMFEKILTTVDQNVAYVIHNDVSQIYTTKNGGLVTMLGNLSLYIGVIFFIIAFVFLVNFIKVALRKQLKEIGILSAMGIDTKGLLKIYGVVTFTVCTITFVVSTLATVFIGNALNGYFSEEFGLIVKVCQLHVLVPIILLIALLGVAFVSCLLPILQYKKQTPAEIINRGLIK